MTGVTWNTQPGIYPAPHAIGTVPSGSTFDIDVTAVLQAARQRSDPTQLWLRVGPAEETIELDSRIEFASKELGDGSMRAELMIFSPTTAPAASPWTLIVIGAALLAIGAAALRRGPTYSGLAS